MTLNTKPKKITGGKNIRLAKSKIEHSKEYNLEEAVAFLQKNKFAKFDETLNIAIRLNTDSSKPDNAVRGVVQMPNGTGKKVIVAALVKDTNEEKARNAGADIVGLDSIIDDIKAGRINFDVCIATPDVMPKISAVAKILGPKGLMPNPKLGTVTTNIEEAIRQVKAGLIEFRTEKAGIIQAGVGKLSFTNDQLVDNVKALVDAVNKSRPTGIKGAFFKSMFVSSSMGPSLRIAFGAI